jgi:hypothetical protein
LDQIYTITTDNGANMLKAVRILASCENNDIDIQEENENKEDDSTDAHLEESDEMSNDKYEAENSNTRNLDVCESIETEDITSSFESNILTGKETCVIMSFYLIILNSNYLKTFTNIYMYIF